MGCAPLRAAPRALGELAAQFAISERTLIRRFKQATGDTPTGYFQTGARASGQADAGKRRTQYRGRDRTGGVRRSQLISPLVQKNHHLSPGEHRKRFALPLH